MIQDRSQSPAGLLRFVLLLGAFFLIGSTGLLAQTLTITSSPFNASTGSADNAAAIQAAINAVGSGGTVVVPAGTFLSGPLTLKSNMTFQIAAGGELQMTPMGTFPSSSDFLYGDNLTNITINGSGVMDGQGAAWWAAFNSNSSTARPPAMIELSGCTGVTVEGITVQNSPEFHIQFLGNGSNILAQGLSITAAWPSPNTDGIDLRGTNVNIKNCYISDGDDVVQIGGSNACSGITVTGCTFGTGHGLSIGSITKGNVSNVLVDSCTFNGTQYGLRLKSNNTEGGVTSNITYSNITMTNIMVNPILMYSYYPNVPSSPTSDTGSAVNSTTPFWENIKFQNVTASQATTGTANVGILWGLPQAPVSNVLFDACTLTGSKIMEVYNTQGVTFDCNCLINGKAPSNTAAVTTFNISEAGPDDVQFPSCGSNPTPTKTNTPVPPTSTFTATKTNTPVPPTATFTFTATKTNTPVPPTATFTSTATHTNTPVPPTATFTSTATHTNTPVPPTATATSTATFTFTFTKTNTPVPPTATFTFTSTKTNTPVPPTATNTPVPPTATFTFTSTKTDTPVPPTATNTSVPPTSTFTNTAVPPTATNTSVPPTSTFTSVPPTATNTPVPPTSTFTNTAVPPTETNTAMPPTATFTTVPPTSTFTNSPVPPTATNTAVPPTATNTAVPPTATHTPMPPTATNTPIPPTATPTHTPMPPSATPSLTFTAVPPTATATHTPAPPTATSTPTPVPPTATDTPAAASSSFKVQLLSGVTSTTTNSPHPQIQVVNTGSGPLNLNNVTVRYWFNCDCTTQSLQAWVDWAGLIPQGTTETGNVQVSVQPTSLGGQTDYVLYTFTGNMVLQPGQSIEVQSRFNKSDWSNMTQSNDWSFAPNTSFTDDLQVTGYLGGSLVWGEQPVAAPAALKVASAMVFPNPSTGSGTTLSFTLSGTQTGPTASSLNANNPLLLDPNAKITLGIYTLGGRLIWSQTLQGGAYGTTGEHQLYWNERDLKGAGIANGLYYLKVTVQSNGQNSSTMAKILITG